MATVDIPTGWDGEKKTDIQKLTVEKKNEISETLFWNVEAVIKDLKEHHVKIEEDVEMMWYEWKKVYINLPAVWEFKWFKFEYFVSYDCVFKGDFESDPELEKKSYSMKEVSNLLKAMNGYMQAMGVETYDFESEEYLETYRPDATYFLTKIAWFDGMYWLKDKKVDWRKKLRTRLRCWFDGWSYPRIRYDDYVAKLFLRLSD